MKKKLTALIMLITMIIMTTSFSKAESPAETAPVLADLGFTFDDFVDRLNDATRYHMTGQSKLEAFRLTESDATSDLFTGEIRITYRKAPIICILHKDTKTDYIKSIMFVFSRSIVIPSPSYVLQMLFGVVYPSPSKASNGQELMELDQFVRDQHRKWWLATEEVGKIGSLENTGKVASTPSVLVNDVLFTCSNDGTNTIIYISPVTHLSYESPLDNVP